MVIVKPSANNELMPSNISLTLPNSETISGSHPIIIIGANGSGKTSLGVTLAYENSGERISALRNLSVPPSLELLTPERATAEVDQHKRNAQNAPWNISQEIGYLLSKLKAKDAQSAVRYRNLSIKNPGGVAPETDLLKLIAFWSRHFPEREIDFSSYTPTAVSKLGRSTDPYTVSQMSDGERVAIYLAARIIDAQAGVVIIDEPEVHLHPVLAKQLWDDLEKMRADCRFVYITHDLHFALSRKAPQFILVRAGGQPEILPPNSDLPDDVFENLLGAASFSVVAKRIVFCEGKRDGERDKRLYKAWFDSKDTAVIPIGSCDRVQQCVEAFNSKETVKGVTAIGIIDRDYWPSEYVDNVRNGVFVLRVHEVENLICLREVFAAVARSLKVPPHQIADKYSSLLSKARSSFKGATLNKQILMRVKKRMEDHLKRLLNKVSNNEDLSVVQASFEKQLMRESWAFEPSNIFEEERDRVQNALSGLEATLLELMPGKSFFEHAADELGVTTARFFEIVEAGLNEVDEQCQPTPLQKELVEALKDYLPPRSCAKPSGFST
jgi:energy-coupling factor transporter ATP-binding protein EcfA2